MDLSYIVAFLSLVVGVIGAISLFAIGYYLVGKGQ